MPFWELGVTDGVSSFSLCFSDGLVVLQVTFPCETVSTDLRYDEISFLVICPSDFAAFLLHLNPLLSQVLLHLEGKHCLVVQPVLERGIIIDRLTDCKKVTYQSNLTREKEIECSVLSAQINCSELTVGSCV